MLLLPLLGALMGLPTAAIALPVSAAGLLLAGGHDGGWAPLANIPGVQEAHAPLHEVASGVWAPLSRSVSVADSIRSSWPRAPPVRPGTGPLDSADELLGPLPSAGRTPWPGALAYEADAWAAVLSARKGGPHHPVALPQRQGSLVGVLSSASQLDWYSLLALTAAIVGMDVAVLQQLPETVRTNLVLLVFWLLVGTAVGVEIWLRRGPEDGMRWLEGYLLEVIFSADRVFVVHFIFSALETPRRLMAKSMFIWLLGVVVARAFFILGLAPTLERLKVVPYCLGLWLVYCGSRQVAACEDGSSDVTQNPVVCGLRAILGNRLGEFYDEEGEAVLMVNKKKACVTLLGATVLCLLSSELVLGLDVALLKVEALGNAFLDFSSAVTAAFAARALFFVVRDIFSVFDLGQYTLGSVLLFLGAETLLARTMYVNALVSCAIVAAILAGAALLSWVHAVPTPKSAY